MEYVWTIYGASYKKEQTSHLLVINMDVAKTFPQTYMNYI